MERKIYNLECIISFSNSTTINHFYVYDGDVNVFNELALPNMTIVYYREACWFKKNDFLRRE
eukprot:snap_masked-scaffold_14-processed-gene-7.33-mRNA-1 protein AED:1.00 eAED:1.00 QI:0/0/0/0/1/1/3/0/61